MINTEYRMMNVEVEAPDPPSLRLRRTKTGAFERIDFRLKINDLRFKI